MGAKSLQEIHDNGPAGMAINAGHAAFQRYKSGVAQTSTQGGLSHAVTLLLARLVEPLMLSTP